MTNDDAAAKLGQELRDIGDAAARLVQELREAPLSDPDLIQELGAELAYVEAGQHIGDLTARLETVIDTMNIVTAVIAINSTKLALELVSGERYYLVLQNADDL